jgi:hypothetical protein
MRRCERARGAREGSQTGRSWSCFRFWCRSDRTWRRSSLSPSLCAAGVRDSTIDSTDSASTSQDSQSATAGREDVRSAKRTAAQMAPSSERQSRRAKRKAQRAKRAARRSATVDSTGGCGAQGADIDNTAREANSSDDRDGTERQAVCSSQATQAESQAEGSSQAKQRASSGSATIESKGGCCCGHEPDIDSTETLVTNSQESATATNSSDHPHDGAVDMQSQPSTRARRLLRRLKRLFKSDNNPHSWFTRSTRMMRWKAKEREREAALKDPSPRLWTSRSRRLFWHEQNNAASSSSDTGLSSLTHTRPRCMALAIAYGVAHISTHRRSRVLVRE